MNDPQVHESEGPVGSAARDAWSRVAGKYVEHCRREVNWNKMIEIPAMRRMLGDVAGKRTLEVGCGCAHYSIWLAQEGAEASGFDPAERLVDQAREDAAAAEVTVDLRVGGLELLAEYPAEHFDIVLFAMMLEYIDDLDAVFAGAARVLKPEGSVAISITHPMRHFSERIEMPDGRRLRVVRGYLRRHVLEWTGWIMGNAEGEDVWCKSHCRPIEDYMSALVRAGFLIEALREPMAIDECHTLAPRIYQSNTDCPQFLLIRVVKRGTEPLSREA